MTVVLLSGGQDSTTCLFWAKRHLGGAKPPIALFVHYGQRHAREYESARVIAGLAETPFYEARVEFPTASSLTRDEPITTRADGLPSTFVAGRNGVLLWLAGGLAKEHGHASIVIGCSSVDFSGYPDCRPKYLYHERDALERGLDTPDFQVHAPLIDRSKAQTVKMARELGETCWTALGMSWTCYLGGERPCGTCPACMLRAKGFADAGEEDPACTP
jgi:7-cyano-7-deazaguanine synthase